MSFLQKLTFFCVRYYVLCTSGSVISENWDQRIAGSRPTVTISVYSFSLNIFYSINTNDIQHTYIVNIQKIRTKA